MNSGITLPHYAAYQIDGSWGKCRQTRVQVSGFLSAALALDSIRLKGIFRNL
jgi:hypothetical protein